MCGGSIGDSSGTIVGCNSVYVSPSLSPVRGTVSEANDSCYGSGEGVAGTSKCVSNEGASADSHYVRMGGGGMRSSCDVQD